MRSRSARLSSHDINLSFTHEVTVVSLIKIIVITLVLLLSILLFWRFLF